jgi:hypothetical protein
VIDLEAGGGGSIIRTSVLRAAMSAAMAGPVRRKPKYGAVKLSGWTFLRSLITR